MGLFASKPKAPPRVPTDRVIPFRFADDFVYTRGLCLDIALRFDDVLDPEKLRESLDILLNKDGWRKLGARLRLNKDNKLEYHVPAEFSAQRPAYLFSTDKQDMSIGDHPVLSKLPRGQSDKPALFDSPRQFRPHMRAPGAPEYLPDWLYADIPQLAVHVLTFHDATIVTVTFMHTLTDAMGFTAFIRAWTAVLRGDEDQVPEFVGFDMSDDPIETLHEGVSSSQYLLADKLVTGWRFFLFVVHLIFQFVWWPKDGMRTVCVPGAYVSKLRESALAELADEAQQTHNEAAGASSPPFLSEGDVLFSWWARIMLRALSPSPQQTICLMNVFDTRGVLCDMGRVSSPDIAMMANATYPLYSLIPAGQFLSETVPLSWIASRVRYAIDTLRTPLQVQAQAAGLRDSAREAGRPPLYGDSGMMLVTCSNWHRGKLFRMDFSAAVVDDPTTGHSPQKIKGYQRGKPSFINATSTETGFSIRNSQVIIGKDGVGNWWIHSCLRVGAWPKVKQQLEGL